MAYEYELLDVITREQLYALQQSYAGSCMYVPRYITEHHRIARLIGLEAAKKVSAEFSLRAAATDSAVVLTVGGAGSLKSAAKALAASNKTHMCIKAMNLFPSSLMGYS